MSRARLNALEVLRQLPRTNCRECGLATCFAFANQVALGQRQADGCPYVAGTLSEEARGLSAEEEGPSGADDDEQLDELTCRVRRVDMLKKIMARHTFAVVGK